MIKILKPEGLNNIREDLINIYISAYKGLEEYAYTRRSDIKRYIKWLYNADKDGLLIAKDGDRTVAFIFFCRNWWDCKYGEIAEIHELVVASEYQNRGIGKKLLMKGMDCMKKYHDIFGLWVGEGNKKARRFYEKIGFLYEERRGKWIRMIKKA